MASSWYLFLGLAILVPVFTSPVEPIPTNNNSQFQPISPQETVTFTLFATDMSNCDPNSACDLVVKLYCLSSDWQPCGETSKKQDDNNPVWPEVFTFEHPGAFQRLRFDLIDIDVAFDDHIASIEVNMDEYVSAPGNLYTVRVPENTGTLWIQRKR